MKNTWIQRAPVSVYQLSQKSLLLNYCLTVSIVCTCSIKWVVFCRNCSWFKEDKYSPNLLIFLRSSSQGTALGCNVTLVCIVASSISRTSNYYLWKSTVTPLFLREVLLLLLLPINLKFCCLQKLPSSWFMLMSI